MKRPDWATKAARHFAVPLDEERSDRVSAALTLAQLIDMAELERRLVRLQRAAFRRGKASK